MSITEMVKEGLHYPFGEKDKILKLGIFFAIIAALNCYLPLLFTSTVYPANADSIFSFVVGIFQSLPTNNLLIMVGIIVVSFVVQLFISGYMVRIIENAINVDISLPSFDNLGEMLVDGVKVLVISIVYQIIPIILMIIGFFVMDHFVAGHNHLLVFGLLIGFIGFLIGIVMYILQLIAIDHYVANDKQLSAALEFRDVLEVVKDIGFFRIFATIIFTSIICGIIGGVVGGIIGGVMSLFFMIPGLTYVVPFIIAILMGLIVSPFLMLFESRVYGSLYNQRS